MSIGLPFIDRIKLLYRDLIGDQHFALNRERSYEVKIRPSSMPIRKPQSPLSGLQAIKLATTLAAPRVSGPADPICWASQGGSRDMEHTRSNLG